jgi:trk system potassium uptake protein TrkH
MHPLLVARVLGLFAILFAATLTAPLLLVWLYDEPNPWPYLLPMLGALGLGALLRLAGLGRQGELGVRDGFLIVALFWLLVSLLGAWPFVLGAGLTPVEALFEAASGFTTTGATVITDLDRMPRSLLFYRQQTQWLGGMGVVVLGLAVIPLLGIGGMQLYRAEAPGPLKEEKLTPRLVYTARNLWLFYLLLTLACALGYRLAGMDSFDAVAHSLSTVSTGVSPAPSTKGQAPSRLTSSQNSATIRKPSRTPSSPFLPSPASLSSTPRPSAPSIGSR